MRITDPGLDANEGTGPVKVSSIMSQIKGKAENDESDKFERATGTPAWEQGPKVTGEVNSNRLKSMLAGLKSKTE
jgi:hypothetical protein